MYLIIINYKVLKNNKLPKKKYLKNNKVLKKKYLKKLKIND